MKFFNLLTTIDEPELNKSEIEAVKEETKAEKKKRREAESEKTAGVVVAIIAGFWILSAITNSGTHVEKEMSRAEKYTEGCYKMGGTDCRTTGKVLDGYLRQINDY